MDLLTSVDGLRGCLALRVPSGIGRGQDNRIVLEGHDITHLVRSIHINSAVDDVVTVEIELVGVKLV